MNLINLIWFEQLFPNVRISQDSIWIVRRYFATQRNGIFSGVWEFYDNVFTKLI